MTVLQDMLDDQQRLQIETYHVDPVGDAQVVEQIKTNVLALTDELHELLGETSWKPWAKGDYVNVEAARGEWIDAWHFMMNLANLLGLDEDSIATRYSSKHAKNVQRQADGYDGVSTKCPGCKRALDDTAVDCYTVESYVLGGVERAGVICQRFGRFYPTDGEQ